MKKIISLVIAILMVLGALALTACDVGDVTVNIGDTQATETSPATDTESNTPSGGAAAQPVKVDSIKGLKVPELVERYYKLLEFKQPFEGVNKTTETVDGKQVSSEAIMKIGKNSLYIKSVEMGDGKYTYEMWIVNSTMYVNQDGLKQKTEGVKFEDFVSQIVDIPERISAQKLEAAELYQLGSSYYFTIELDAEESAAYGYEEKTHNVTFYFDANGNITKTVVTRLGFSETETFSNVGGNVVINPPSDASSYTTSGGAVDGDVYSTYKAVFEKIDNAKVYAMSVVSDEELIMDYAIDYAGDQYMMVVSEGEPYYMYAVGGKGYVATDDSDLQQIEYSDDMKMQFDSTKNVKSSMKTLMVPSGAVDDMEMKYYADTDDYTITYTLNSTDQTMEFEICFDKNMENIEIAWTTYYTDGDVESAIYGFYDIDNPYLDVYV